MNANVRLDQILHRVDEKGYATIAELSRLLHVSEMTIRRDLEKLAAGNRILRTRGGAASNRSALPGKLKEAEAGQENEWLNCPGDVLIAASLSPKIGVQFLGVNSKLHIPIISEALPQQNTQACVGIDDLQAGIDLGRWAGQYALEHWGGVAKVLDLTYHFPNTEARSRGFLSGLREVIPSFDDVLSINPQSRYDLAYQLTRDALTVNRDFNIIMAINDTNACGAIDACRELGIDPQSLIVLSFGLEGETLRNALVNDKFYQAGLAMFPEIVGPACVLAAIAAYNRQPLPERIYTPYMILTRANLADYYTRQADRWQINREVFARELDRVSGILPRPGKYPACIGVILPFGEHEWYQNLMAAMRAYAGQFDIHIEIVDIEKTIQGEIDLRQRDIARYAAEQIAPDDAIFIDSGPAAVHLAQLLTERQNLTVVTNSLPVIDALKNSPGITLISTGGVVRKSSQSLVGPTAEQSLQDMRVDKLFLTVTGVSLNFGLSHTNISEVTIKQTMLRTAREVFLLADYTCFGEESMLQVAPLNVVHKLISDNALPASLRLNLTRLGIEVLIAS